MSDDIVEGKVARGVREGLVEAVDQIKKRDKSKIWSKLGGPTPHFDTPEDLLKAAITYFEWAADHPLLEAKSVTDDGKQKIIELPKMRAMTLQGLCTFLNIGFSSWYDYKKREAFTSTCETIATVLYTQKFEGAAAGILNGNIIARDLGLSDTVDNNHSYEGGKLPEIQISFIGADKIETDEEG